METKELKKVLEEYFDLVFVVIDKPDFNQYFIQFMVNHKLPSINYKWDNHFDKESNLSAICNQIKAKILEAFIR